MSSLPPCPHHSTTTTRLLDYYESVLPRTSTNRNQNCNSKNSTLSIRPNFKKKMTEIQQIRDRKIRSSNYFFNRINKINGIKRAKDVIRDLERHGPAGLLHIIILSNIIGKPIQIWDANGSLNRIIGKGKAGCPVDIEYHAINSEQIGHWTLKNGKDPDNISIDLNNCLFSVIGSQIGHNPSKLRKWTILNLKSNFRKLANLMAKILRLEKDGKIILMIGGARYDGTSSNDAKIILDRSQDQPCHGYPSRGHPRQHALHPSDVNVINYSIQHRSRKSGFLSQTDQDHVAHLALSTREAQNAMRTLNNGGTSVYVEIDSIHLRKNQNNVPRAREYINGELTKEGEIKTVAFVLRHHIGQYNNPNADVFVLTFYPKI
ncbi:uncharacterized protein [Anoplolepis gracilipes]|uniref:uncharacterized protein n=1 Tax=Anoplolepis gracilipes TaxID=354296 RepID=UPI003B9DF8B3